MSVNYGGPYGGNPYGGNPYGGGGGYAPPGRVNFGWVGESWQIFGRAAGIWILAILLYGIVTSIVNGILASAFPNPGYVAPPGPFGGYHYGAHYGTNSNMTPLGQALAILFSWVFGAFQSGSLYHLAVKQVRGEPVSFGDTVSGGPYFLNMLVLTLLATLACVAGFFMLCVGLFIAAAFLLPAQALVADGRSALDALSLSVDGMKKDWMNGTLLVFVFSLLTVASLIPCGLGLFVTLPMLHVISALAYRDMIGMPNLAPPPVPGYGAPPYGAPPYGAPNVWPPPPGAAQPPPSFGQPPAYGQPPPNPYASPPAPPRTTLGGDDINDKGDVVPPPTG